MPTTPKLAIPYVAPTDLLSAYPAADQAQATRVEDILTTRVRTGSWITAAAGWSITTAQMDVMGKMAQFLVNFTRTGATITVPANGDIATQTIGTYNTTTWVVSSYGPITSWSAGRMCQCTLSGANFSMVACAPGGDILVNDVFSAVGSLWLT